MKKKCLLVQESSDYYPDYFCLLEIKRNLFYILDL